MCAGSLDFIPFLGLKARAHTVVRPYQGNGDLCTR